jgi:type III secretory pathway component EscT
MELVDELGGVSNSSSSTSNSSSSSCPFGSLLHGKPILIIQYWEADEGGTATWDSELGRWDSVTFRFPGVEV